MSGSKPELIMDIRELHSFSEFTQMILLKSGLFDIKKIMMPEFSAYLKLKDELGRHRHCYGDLAFIRIDGHLIVLDSQYTIGKAHELYNAGLFNNMDINLYIKHENDRSLSIKLGCPVRSWIQFPGGWGMVQKFKWGKRPLRTAMLVSSNNSLRIMKRTEWFDKANRLDTFDTAIGIPQKDYIRHLERSKWGVILSRGDDHNTREYEFISNHMPLALNYWPECNFPFYPDEQFLYMKTPNDLEKLLHIDPQRFHHQSIILWNNYLRPDKAAQTLMKMII